MLAAIPTECVLCWPRVMLSQLDSLRSYGPISDNAGGIAEMAGMGEDIRERTGALFARGPSGVEGSSVRAWQLQAPARHWR